MCQMISFRFLLQFSSSQRCIILFQLFIANECDYEYMSDGMEQSWEKKSDNEWKKFNHLLQRERNES